jgi:phosphoglycerol transferase MdoB-like AlkP superfamily enzyme
VPTRRAVYSSGPSNLPDRDGWVDTDVMRTRGAVSTTLLLAVLLCSVVGLVVHVLTYLSIDPREKIKTLWYALQFSSALAFIAALIFLSRTKDATDTSASDSYAIILVSCIGIFAAYAIFNLLYTGMVLNHDATPRIVDGQYVLYSHGGVSKPLTAAEFIKHQIYEARMHSGHWMAFYLIAAAAIYKRMR